MRAFGIRALGAVTASITLMTPVAATAAECVAQEDVSDAVIYSMPLMLDAVSGKCGDTLEIDGFLAVEGDRLRSDFAERQGSHWAGTFRLLAQFADRGRAPGGKRNPEFAEMIQNLPEEAVRPFADALIQQEVGKAIPLKECANIERGLALLSPLPPENWGGLASFLFDMAGVKDPAMCPYEPE